MYADHLAAEATELLQDMILSGCVNDAVLG